MYCKNQYAFFKKKFSYRLYELMNQLSCMIATAMNQNEGWHKTGNIAQMYSALKCEEKLQNLILEAQFGRQYTVLLL